MRGRMSNYVPATAGTGKEGSKANEEGGAIPTNIQLFPTSIDRNWSSSPTSTEVRDMRSAIGGGPTFQALLEAAPDAIVAVDREGGIRLGNAQTERPFGDSRGEMPGVSVGRVGPETGRGGHPP